MDAILLSNTVDALLSFLRVFVGALGVVLLLMVVLMVMAGGPRPWR